jgi:hypothetical protein
MEKLPAMILTAYDPRRNPAAGLLGNAASHAFKVKGMSVEGMASP